MFEYHITYYEMNYYIEKKEDLSGIPSPLSGTAMPSLPDTTLLENNEDYLAEMKSLGESGWEMVSVVPLLMANYHEGLGIGYSLTAGYYVFWKREKTEE